MLAVRKPRTTRTAASVKSLVATRSSRLIPHPPVTGRVVLRPQSNEGHLRDPETGPAANLETGTGRWAIARTTYDRLVGPVAVATREAEAHPSLEMPARRVLVAHDIDRWRVVRGQRPTPVLYREIAEFASLGEPRIRAAAARFGLIGRVPGVDDERAIRLISDIRLRLQRGPDAPPHDPLIRYEAGEDPRPMWKLSAVDTLTRDAADDAADAIHWALTEMRRFGPAAVEWERVAAAAGAGWLPGDGMANLYRLVVAALAQHRVGSATVWPAAFAHALLVAATRTAAGRSLWHGLSVIAPLLLAIVDREEHPSSTRRPAARFIYDGIDAWRGLAREAEAWLELIGELRRLERDRLAGRSRSTDIIRAKVMQLDARIARGFGDLRIHLHDLDATDTHGIAAALRAVVQHRLAMTGFDPDTPFGTLIGAEAALLLSVRADLSAGTCRMCGAETQGRRWYCTRHQQERWKLNKRAARGRKGRQRPKPNGSVRSAVRRPLPQ